MDNKFDRLKLLAYINNPMSKESVSMILSSNNIIFEKCELYSDFVQSLLLTIFDTYLGDDVTNMDSQVNHFNWCWNKVILDFKKEGLDFSNDRLYNYFLEFTIEVFYTYNDKEPFNYIDKGVLNIWLEVFNINKTKTNSELDTLVEIYCIFEESLKKT